MTLARHSDHLNFEQHLSRRIFLDKSESLRWNLKKQTDLKLQSSHQQENKAKRTPDSENIGDTQMCETYVTSKSKLIMLTQWWFEGLGILNYNSTWKLGAVTWGISFLDSGAVQRGTIIISLSIFSFPTCEFSNYSSSWIQYNIRTLWPGQAMFSPLRLDCTNK